MLGLAKLTDKGAQLRDDVAAYLYDVFSNEDTSLSSLDRWTQRRVIDENMAKIALVLESDDPIEHCYQNLVREIDTEAESGIHLVHANSKVRELRELAGDPGISGKLRRHIEEIAPVVFPDELEHSANGMDLVWVTIEARHDRAKIDATVSEMIMAHVVDDDCCIEDMSQALRSLLYSFHEDHVRRLCKLPLVLNERATRELILMISELADRAGDYQDRVKAITERAGTH